MTKANIEDLQAYLSGKGHDAQLQKETNQIYIVLKLLEREFPLFLRIMGEGDLLQMMVFFPCNVKDEAVADLARLLHLLNKELDIPGFGMDEKAKVAFYRCMIPAIDGEIHDGVLEAYMNSMKLVCETFTPAVEAVAYAATTLEELLEKAAEHDEKQS